MASGDEGGKDQYQGQADADTDLGAIGQTRFGGFDGEAFVSCSWYRTKGGRNRSRNRSRSGSSR